MEEKTINPFSVLSFTTRATMADLMNLAVVKMQEMQKDAAQHDVVINGPVSWIFYGMDDKPETIFTLDIVLPAEEKSGYRGNFEMKKLAPFKCISSLYKGPWDKVGDTYAGIFGEIGQKGYAHTGECREIYKMIDLEHPENNLTEVQVGIQ
jgi:effector-binding domain-containing protein